MAVEWRSGLAGHLILSDEDVTSVVQGTWKRLNTLQHYKVRIQSAIALSLLLSFYTLSCSVCGSGSWWTTVKNLDLSCRAFSD